MPEDDTSADDGPLGRPLPPEDRLWRHPTEVSWPPVAIARPTASAPKVWSIALASGITGAVLAVGIVALVSDLGGGVTERVTERVPVDDELVELAGKGHLAGVPAVAAAVSPSVVRLEVGAGGETTTGSGVVLRDDGTILTNARVVEGARTVTVVLADGSALSAHVVGADRLTDIAVIAVDDPGDGEWVPAVIGTSEAVEVGETAIAIGSSLGLAGGPSVTVGVVSGLGRRVTAGTLVLHDMIQTDAPIASGSSGGALCDRSGVVIGITTALATTDAGPDGLGFAVPIEAATAVADELLGHGVVRWSWLGIEGTDLAPTQASLPGMVDMGGVRVLEVDLAGPAAAAGMAPGDVVVAFEGTRVASMSDLVVALRGREPGDVVVVDVIRGQDRVALEVVLAERPG